MASSKVWSGMVWGDGSRVVWAGFVFRACLISCHSWLSGNTWILPDWTPLRIYLPPLKQECTYTKIAVDVITTSCRDIAQRNTLLATKLRYPSTVIQSEIRFIRLLCLYGDIHIRNYRKSSLGSIRHLISCIQHLVASGRDSAICVNSRRYTHRFK